MKSLTQLTCRALTIVVTLFFFSSGSNAQTYEKYYLDGQIFVKFHDDFDPQIPVAIDKSVRKQDATFFADFFDRYEVLEITRPLDAANCIKLLRTFQLSFSDHKVLDQVIEEMEKMPEIEYAEKVPLYYTDHVPNDSLYHLVNGPLKWKWHLDVINAEQAWDVTKGSPDIKIAIVDNAVWSNHPDLASEIVLQWDVTNNQPNSNPPSFGDPGDWSHGSHCAGLASAATNNNIGVAAIGYNTSLIGIRASSSTPNSITHSYQGVNFAVNNGADVISMSFGGAGYSQSFQNLVNAGNSLGIVFFASAGNEDNSIIRYPAGYNHVIAVAATNDNDTKAWFSSYGSYVTISAPGGSASPGPDGLLSSTFDNTSLGYYDYYFGTSMACPVAAGLGGLMKSINPELTPADLQAILEATAVNIDAVNPDYIGQLGAGRIDAYEAVKAVPFSPQTAFKTQVRTILPGTAIDFTDLTSGIPSAWNWTFENGFPDTSTDQHPTGITYGLPGSYSVSLTAQNAYGSETITIEDYIVVTATPTPYVMFAASTDFACIFETITFEDMTLYDPETWLWEFEPSTVMFINGTDANSQHPEVVFTSPGVYDVIVTSTNTNGSTTTTFEEFFVIDGIDLPFLEDFETGNSEHFNLYSNSKAFVRVNTRSANESSYGLHFTGSGSPAGWSGSPTGTTPHQAWNVNVDFQAFANVCNVDATDMSSVYLSFDLRQTYSFGPKFSWLRVLINDTIQVADMLGVLDFNPATNTDPFERKIFNLSQFAGTAFSVTYQTSTRLHDKVQAEGDNVFIDNIIINNTLADLPGDANCDGMINISDVVVIIAYIVGDNPEPFCFENADLNEDQIINVQDVVGVVNIILSGGKFGFEPVVSQPAQLFLHEQGIDLQSDGTLAGLQFDIEGINPDDVEFMLEGYQFRSAEVDGMFRGIIFSFDNTPLPAGIPNIIRFKQKQTHPAWGDVAAANLNAQKVEVIKSEGLSIPESSTGEMISVFPNPFTGSTTLKYQLANIAHVEISLYSLDGKLQKQLISKVQAAGEYQQGIDAVELNAGIYLCRAIIGDKTSMQKIVVLK
jgi:PKD repeat protein